MNKQTCKTLLTEYLIILVLELINDRDFFEEVNDNKNNDEDEDANFLLARIKVDIIIIILNK